jgi:uncharacterized membrane protein
MSDIALQPALFRQRRWSVVALVASLILNAFFVGVAATHFLRPIGDFESERLHHLRFELRWLAGKLSRNGVDHIEAAVGGLIPGAEAHIEKMRELRRGLGKLIAQPNPDRAAIEARLAEIRAELQAMQTEVQEGVVNALLTLPPDERTKLAEASGAAKQ